MDEADEGAKDDAAPETPPKAPTPSPVTPAHPSEWTASDSRGPLIEASGEGQPTPVPETDASVHQAPYVVPAPAAADTNHETPRAPDDPPIKEPVRPEPKRGSSWPIALGLIGGAIIGAGAALYVDRTNGGGDTQGSALADKIATVQSESDAKIDALQKTVANLSKSAASPTVFDPAPLKQDIAALKASVANLRKDSAGTEGIDTKLRDLGARLDGIESAIGTLKKDDAAAQSGLQALRDDQQTLAGKVGSPALAVVSDSLVQAIGHGQPYATQLDALASFGADPTKLAVLKQNAPTGVPSAKTLAAKFAVLAEPILATEHKAPPNAGFMDRLKSGMSSLVSIRRADDFSGTDLSSRVGRIQADLSHDDLVDALATWDALPADAKAKSDAWGAQLKASADAMSAARALQMQAIVAMSAKKS